jgi:hypothetical protein
MAIKKSKSLYYLVVTTLIFCLTLGFLHYSDLKEGNDNPPTGLNKLPDARNEEKPKPKGTDNEEIRNLVAKTGQGQQGREV